MPNDDVANNWRNLSGEGEWRRLLDPFNERLRRYIIRYGEMVQATYDGIDDDTSSRMYGFPRFRKEDLFSKVDLDINNPYRVTNYLYATSECDFPEEYPGDWVVKDRSSWIGYVAVTTDEGKEVLGRRDILICWRGSPSAADWFENFDSTLVPAPEIFPNINHPEPKVHEGIRSVYITDSPTSKYNGLSARKQVLQAVREQLEPYRNEEISITVAGHNVGAGLATLNAVDIARNIHIGEGRQCLVTAFVFGSPKVGDRLFATAFQEQHNLHLLNIKNVPDIVPGLPNGDYVPVGIPFEIDTTRSTFVRPPRDHTARCYNDLEYYLHGVAWSTQEETVVGHDFALVNKHLDVLRDEFEIPPYWWVPVLNKGVVRQPDGHWKWDPYVPDPPAAAAPAAAPAPAAAAVAPAPAAVAPAPAAAAPAAAAAAAPA